MYSRALDAHDDAEVDRQPRGVVTRAAIATFVVSGHVSDKGHECPLKFFVAFIVAFVGFVLEGLGHDFFLGVDQDRHPLVLLGFGFGLGKKVQKKF